MAKKTAAPKSVEELVQHALKLAATNPKANWSGKSAKALFNENEANTAEAMKQCLDPKLPLLNQVDKGAVLTTAGFERIAGTLPEDEVGPLAKATAAGMSAVERVAFFQGMISRTPYAAAELSPLLEEAIVAKNDELEAQTAAKVTQAATAATNRAALERALELSKRDFENEVNALKRQWEALGQKLSDLPTHKPAPEPEPDPRPKPRPTGTGSEPKTNEEKDFRRETTERLVSAWLYNTRHNKADAAVALERILRGIDGVQAVGSVGDTVSFDGKIHECERAVSDGERVRIVRIGWAIVGDSNGLLQRALVE